MSHDDRQVRPFLIQTSFATIAATVERDKLVGIDLSGDGVRAPETDTECLVADQLIEYAAGKRTRFDLPFLARGSDFQRQVWNALLDIPFGETTTYGEVATRIGAPRAARAVGAANNANPIPIVIPCHRVVGRGGALVGFGSGLEMKRTLLAIEARGLIDLPPERGYLSTVQ